MAQKSCFGKMTSAGFNKDCDRCPDRTACLLETNRRLQQQEQTMKRLEFPSCRLGVCE